MTTVKNARSMALKRGRLVILLSAESGMLHRIAGLSLVALCITCGACTADRICITQQYVTVRVIDLGSGLPLVGAIVDLREDDTCSGAAITKAPEPDWVSGGLTKSTVIGEDGVAELVAKIVTVEGGAKRLAFDPERDRVTGMPYCLRVRRGAIDEVLRMVIKETSSVRGSAIELTVLRIGESKEEKEDL